MKMRHFLPLLAMLACGTAVFGQDGLRGLPGPGDMRPPAAGGYDRPIRLPPIEYRPAAAEPRIATPAEEMLGHPASTPTCDPAALGPSACALLQPGAIQSSWYTRIDYFHWNERIEGEDFVNEYGTLLALGYQRRYGHERYRVELFGGTMNYVGAVQGGGLDGVPLRGDTGYLGLRGEYDYLFEPSWWSNTNIFLGIGARFWVRDLKDSYTDEGDLVSGYLESWWTIYPYLGLETHRTLANGAVFYVSGRLGFTAMTYEHATWGDVSLYPKAGMIGQTELGVRGKRFFLAGSLEVLSWAKSNVARDAYQPASQLLTAGLRTGVVF
jgi:hypothetical protein